MPSFWFVKYGGIDRPPKDYRACVKYTHARNPLTVKMKCHPRSCENIFFLFFVYSDFICESEIAFFVGEYCIWLDFCYFSHVIVVISSCHRSCQLGVCICVCLQLFHSDFYCSSGRILSWRRKSRWVLLLSIYPYSNFQDFIYTISPMLFVHNT